MRRLLQLTLDLFDAAPPPAPPAAPAPPAVPIRDVLHPGAYSHPQANRRIHLGDAVVAYALRRARRRTIGFTVGPDGLAVAAPTWVGQGEIDAALRAKAAWVVRKLAEFRDRQARVAQAAIAWGDGALLPYLGAPLRVVLDGAQRGGRALLCTAPDGERQLRLALPAAATAQQVRDAVQAWIMREARALFVQRLDHFAPQLGVQWKRLALSSAQTRWGSARSDGSIRLNWRLMHFGLPVIDYVVAHELAHLRVMDHSPRFWDTVATVCPDHAALRSRLRDEALPAWR
ncbi:M48 family metallopeptidase [Xylophilus sp.]|uniref:M48 family metallopeptidase n=1 Tax=Xylophilus sp. TaxID=2653893 RepID=UPI0013BE7777|nr:SprT family zinc-dependent metalloprotease [Xylophilus sp.]KAF1046209.1 MAG: hypothetical protein GAK38_02606 [Xylophilus sp.]